MKVLVLGVTGMLGNAVFKLFSQDAQFEVFATMRSASGLRYFSSESHSRLFTGVDVLNHDELVAVFAQVQPDVVINCVGLIKQLADANDPLTALPINAMLPHRLSRLCALIDARLVHVSTDCVFSGRQGGYCESDTSDAEDLYGKSKFIGELQGMSHVITLRTSIIGHELNSHYALIDWFLSQSGPIKGFSRAVFSGLPTVELARVIKDYVLPRPELNGLYHVAAKPINKFDLLGLVAQQYSKEIEIRKDDAFVIDRSLNADAFGAASGYVAPEWPILIQRMYDAK
ncbi:MAG: SDR family oxidoreductase [Gammaproteobacteria bacterium]|jgi:dTDP-4-dehydrorhamnose reductase|nr:SDR family oxidoreductase [Gammaproteobacteria bacterium]MBQ0774117.1 SDR family oxidoreductase [Gammaproteobacteria bacterium]